MNRNVLSDTTECVRTMPRVTRSSNTHLQACSWAARVVDISSQLMGPIKPPFDYSCLLREHRDLQVQLTGPV